MKKTFSIFLFLAACAGEAEETVLSPIEFQSKLKETPDAILLDVRRLEEIADVRLENSQSIVYDESFETKLANLEQKPLFVYCASGKRSAKAAAILRSKGYRNVYELDGGLGAWKEAGLPVDDSQK
jgi:rhodanese-related sulfurtransferase